MMVKKKKSVKKSKKKVSKKDELKVVGKEEIGVEDVIPSKRSKKLDPKKYPTLKIKREDEIALDFATKVYKKFNKIIKSIVLFGSSVKNTAVAGSDIDLIILIDDVAVRWDQELIAWYREELDKIAKGNPYNRELHINTVRLSTWWEDLMRGDPVLINIIRYGEPVLDMGGFFEPLKYLLVMGKIKATPEAVYNCLKRAPMHFNNSKIAELNAIEGLYWAMVDSAHAALISAGIVPPSPEHIPGDLKETFVNAKRLKMDFVLAYRDLFILHKKIAHGEVTNLTGVEIDEWQKRTEEFMDEMTRLVKESIA